MPHILIAVEDLEDEPAVGDGDCVALVKQHVPGLTGIPTASWRAGKRVKEVKNLSKGTAIATFVNGRYPNKVTGNHAAIFLQHSGSGFWVLDQWKGKPLIKRRFIFGARPRIKVNADGSWPDASNVADAFYVIER